jgi:hypothetical protein
MVGRMTLDHVVEGSNPSPAANLLWRRYRLGVRTGGSQPSNQGSIPCSATNPVFNNLYSSNPSHQRFIHSLELLKKYSYLAKERGDRRYHKTDVSHVLCPYVFTTVNSMLDRTALNRYRIITCFYCGFSPVHRD